MQRHDIAIVMFPAGVGPLWGVCLLTHSCRERVDCILGKRNSFMMFQAAKDRICSCIVESARACILVPERSMDICFAQCHWRTVETGLSLFQFTDVSTLTLAMIARFENFLGIWLTPANLYFVMFQVDQDHPPLVDSGERARKFNVAVCMYLFFARAVQYAIASRDFLDTYILDISGSNETVGQIESICGIAALIVLMPCGYLADRCKRLRLLRFLALLKAIPTVMAFVAVRQKNLLLLQVAMVLLAVVPCGIGTPFSFAHADILVNTLLIHVNTVDL